MGGGWGGGGGGGAQVMAIGWRGKGWGEAIGGAASGRGAGAELIILLENVFILVDTCFIAFYS